MPTQEDMQAQIQALETELEQKRAALQVYENANASAYVESLREQIVNIEQRLAVAQQEQVKALPEKGLRSPETVQKQIQQLEEQIQQLKEDIEPKRQIIAGYDGIGDMAEEEYIKDEKALLKSEEDELARLQETVKTLKIELDNIKAVAALPKNQDALNALLFETQDKVAALDPEENAEELNQGQTKLIQLSYAMAEHDFREKENLSHKTKEGIQNKTAGYVESLNVLKNYDPNPNKELHGKQIIFQSDQIAKKAIAEHIAKQMQAANPSDIKEMESLKQEIEKAIKDNKEATGFKLWNKGGELNKHLSNALTTVDNTISALHKIESAPKPAKPGG